MDSDDEQIPVTPKDISDDCDVQGIRWKDFYPTTRTTFRDQRIANYRNYRNCSTSHDVIYNDLHQGYTDGAFFDFRYTLTKHKYKCSEYHFQLRNLLWSTTKHSVYYSHQESIREWNSITRDSSVALKYDGFRTSTISACKDVVLMGGFNGEFVCRFLREGDDINAIRTGVLTTDPMGITNHVELADDKSGELTGVISSNDNKVRLLNMSRLQITKEFDFPWAANCSSMSPDKRIICVCGDATESSIVNTDTGDKVMKLTGHIDFSFACAWSPCGRFIATGNQDLTSRVYDIRNPSNALVVLPTIVGAVRSLRFSDDGSFLVASEPCDFVHIYDFDGTASNLAKTSFYTHTIASSPANASNDSIQQQQQENHGPLGTNAFQSQIIDFFGEIAGVSFTPDGGDTLYIGVSDQRYGSILEYERRKGVGKVFLEDVVV
ncbi:UNVERIFIED_CONTAM: hypothetical protein HDU68_000005 [Siphonaria sp. JEL0065]|nr:hypothetical protein HDU68_000005 [Siphonaria sp. JEL0065]